MHRHVAECVIVFLTVPQRACARRASKALWGAVTATSMEDMLRATVLEQRDTRAVDAQLVVVVMSRVAGWSAFSSADALVAWSGGLGPLYDELQMRFPTAAAIGVSARLAAILPFPFANGSATMTVCVVTAVVSAPSALVVESVVLGVRDATNVLVRALSHDGSRCPILCLEGATPERFPNVVHDVLRLSSSAGTVKRCLKTSHFSSIRVPRDIAAAREHRELCIRGVRASLQCGALWSAFLAYNRSVRLPTVRVPSRDHPRKPATARAHWGVCFR